MADDVDNCHVQHVSNNNLQTKYIMDNVQLTSVDREKDLLHRCCSSNDLKPNSQCSKVIKIANKLVTFIGRTFD